MLATAPLTFPVGSDVFNPVGEFFSKKEYFLNRAAGSPVDKLSDDRHWPVVPVPAEDDAGCHLTPDVLIDPAATEARQLVRETGGQFVLGQNFPNPYVDETTIPFTLTNEADVRLELFDPQGRKVAGILRCNLSAGEQKIHLNLHGLSLPAGTYMYQLQVTNRYGTFQQRRPMTAGQ